MPSSGLLAAIPLISPVVRRELGLLTRRGRALSPAAAQLYGFIADLKKPMLS
jgi:DNA-binding transcriptional LysR family regulator